MIYTFNAVYFCILAVFAIVATISIKARSLVPFVSLCNCCCVNIVYLIMLIMTLVYRFDDIGAKCSFQNEAYDDEGNTWLQDAKLLKNLSISAMATYFVYYCII